MARRRRRRWPEDLVGGVLTLLIEAGVVVALALAALGTAAFMLSLAG